MPPIPLDGHAKARKPGASPLTLTRTLGLSYLAITLCGALGVGVLDGALQVEGDHAATAANILAHEMTFRWAIVSVLVIYSSVLVAAWAMYEILAPVNRPLSLLALLFRTAEGIVGLATSMTSLMVLQLLRAQGPTAGLEDGQVAAWVGLLLELRTAALDVVLCLIGVGGTLFLWLFRRAGVIPGWLSLWGLVTYVSMLGLASVSIVFPDHSRSMETILYASGAAFEGVFAVWMLTRSKTWLQSATG